MQFDRQLRSIQMNREVERIAASFTFNSESRVHITHLNKTLDLFTLARFLDETVDFKSFGRPFIRHFLKMGDEYSRFDILVHFSVEGTVDVHLKSNCTVKDITRALRRVSEILVHSECISRNSL